MGLLDNVPFWCHFVSFPIFSQLVSSQLVVLVSFCSPVLHVSNLPPYISLFSYFWLQSIPLRTVVFSLVAFTRDIISVLGVTRGSSKKIKHKLCSCGICAVTSTLLLLVAVRVSRTNLHLSPPPNFSRRRRSSRPSATGHRTSAIGHRPPAGEDRLHVDPSERRQHSSTASNARPTNERPIFGISRDF